MERERKTDRRDPDPETQGNPKRREPETQIPEPASAEESQALIEELARRHAARFNSLPKAELALFESPQPDVPPDADDEGDDDGEDMDDDDADGEVIAPAAVAPTKKK